MEHKGLEELINHIQELKNLTQLQFSIIEEKQKNILALQEERESHLRRIADLESQVGSLTSINALSNGNTQDLDTAQIYLDEILTSLQEGLKYLESINVEEIESN